MTRPLLLVLLIPFFAACSGLSSRDFDPAASQVTLERTSLGISGTSTYKVTLHGDGRVEYLGIANVEAKGPQTKRISRSAAAAVFAKLDAIHFWDLPDLAGARAVQSGGETIYMRAFDAPSFVVTATQGPRTHRVETTTNGAADLRELRLLIDRTTGTAAWIGHADFESGQNH